VQKDLISLSLTTINSVEVKHNLIFIHLFIHSFIYAFINSLFVMSVCYQSCPLVLYIYTCGCQLSDLWIMWLMWRQCRVVLILKTQVVQKCKISLKLFCHVTNWTKREWLKGEEGMLIIHVVKWSVNFTLSILASSRPLFYCKILPYFFLINKFIIF